MKTPQLASVTLLALSLLCACPAIVEEVGQLPTDTESNGGTGSSDGSETSMSETETSTTATSVSGTSAGSSSSGTNITAATTDGDSTGESSTGEVTGCDPFPSEGAPCPIDGESCSTDCTDQCQFCNVMTCEGGVWARLEVFPTDCLECAALCALVVPAGCSAGPPNIDACLAGCELELEGDCVAEFSQTRACAGPNPTFVCSDVEQPEAVGCEAQYDTFYACMAG